MTDMRDVRIIRVTSGMAARTEAAGPDVCSSDERIPALTRLLGLKGDQGEKDY